MPARSSAWSSPPNASAREGVGRAVLIVEDEAIVARDIEAEVVALGHRVVGVARSCDEALESARRERPDLVLMDVRLEGERDGIATALALRALAEVPVVYLTAHADSETLGRAKATEPLGYLIKPFKPIELRTIVELALHRHDLEDRLRRRERWMSTMLRSLGDAVIATDLTGRITYVNPSAVAVIGRSADDLLDRPAREVLRVAGDGELPLERALREGRTVKVELTALAGQPGEEPRWITDTAAPVLDGEQVLGAIMVFRDVTLERQERERLEVADRLASLGTLAAGVAHEINNPLGVVSMDAGFCENELATMLDESGSGPGDPARLARILDTTRDLQSAVARMARIVSDLRTFGQPRRSEPTAVDVGRAVGWALRTTSHEVRGRARVVTDLHPVPAVQGDEVRLGQVIINLLMNAAHAVAPGRPDDNEVRVGVATDAAGRVVIEVRDTGTGMTPEVLRRVFEPFYTTKPQGVGTGLGLSISHGIVTSMGGEIQVESRPGHGSTFRVLLPPAPPPPSRRGASETLPRMRILVIDDDAAVLRGIRRMLEREHTVTMESSAERALERLARGEVFDAILCDIIMPGLDGTGFHRRLAAAQPEQADRVIFLSGGTSRPDTLAYLASLPNRSLGKPFSSHELRSALSELATPT